MFIMTEKYKQATSDIFTIIKSSKDTTTIHSSSSTLPSSQGTFSILIEMTLNVSVVAA